MTPEQFVYWLQGFVELHPSLDKEWSKNWTPTSDQWKMIIAHLNQVLCKKTPITEFNKLYCGEKAAEDIFPPKFIC